MPVYRRKTSADPYQLVTGTTTAVPDPVQKASAAEEIALGATGDVRPLTPKQNPNPQIPDPLSDPVPRDPSIPLDPVTLEPRNDTNNPKSDQPNFNPHDPGPPANSNLLLDATFQTQWGTQPVKARKYDVWVPPSDKSRGNVTSGWQGFMLYEPPDYLDAAGKAQWQAKNQEFLAEIKRFQDEYGMRGERPYGGNSPWRDENNNQLMADEAYNQLTRGYQTLYDGQKTIAGATMPPGYQTQLPVTGDRTGVAGTDQYKAMQDLKNQASTSGAGSAQQVVTGAMAGYQSQQQGDTPIGESGGSSFRGTGTQSDATTELITGSGAATQTTPGQAQTTQGQTPVPQAGDKTAQLSDLQRQRQQAMQVGDQVKVAQITQQMDALSAGTQAAPTQAQDFTQQTAAAGGGAGQASTTGGAPVADGGSTGGGTAEQTTVSFEELLNKVKQGVGVTPNDVPTGLTQEFLDSVMRQSPELTEEQKTVINRQADEAMAKALSALSARGIGVGSDAAKAIVEGEFRRTALIAAEQARVRSEHTQAALQAAGLSIENLKNAQGYSLNQRLASLQETLGIGELVQKQKDAAARANEFAKTFGLDQAKFGEAVRQYNMSFGLEKEKFDEIKNQFAQQFGLDTEKYHEAVREFEKQFGLETEKFAEAKNQFEKEFGLKVDDQAFIHALETGKLNLEAFRIDNEVRLKEIQIANDFLSKANELDLQRDLGFSKLDLEAMIAGKEIDLKTLELGIEKWAKQNGFDISMAELELELEALKASNKEDWLGVIGQFGTTILKMYMMSQGSPPPVPV